MAGLASDQRSFQNVSARRKSDHYMVIAFRGLKRPSLPGLAFVLAPRENRSRRHFQQVPRINLNKVSLVLLPVWAYELFLITMRSFTR